MTQTHSRSQYYVGAFVLSGLAAILVSIFLIGANTSMFAKRISLLVHFDQVQGLAPGSMVSMSGIRVGNVDDVFYVADLGKVQITMTVDQELVRDMGNDSVVEIRTQGALGDKFLFITPGSSTAPKVRDGDTLEVAPATDLFAVLSDRGKDAEKLFEILSDVRKATKAISEKDHVEKIMENILKASRNIASASEKWSEVDPHKLQSALNHLESVAMKVDRGQGTLGALINDPALHDRLKSLLGDNSRRDHLKSMIRTSIEKSENK